MQDFVDLELSMNSILIMHQQHQSLNDNLCICRMVLGQKYQGQSLQQFSLWQTHLTVQEDLNERKMQMMLLIDGKLGRKKVDKISMSQDEH